MISGKVRILGALVVLVIALELFTFAGSLGSARVAAGSVNPVPSAPPPAQTPLSLNLTISGAGASFPAPLLFNWTTMYHITHPNVTLSYGSVGSGRGQSAALNKTVDFGATDAPLSTRQLSVYPGILHIPETIGAVTLAYNIPLPTGGVVPIGGLNLTGSVVVGIFLGSITNWNDPLIAAINPGLVRAAQLPNHTIMTAHRSDGSGTTFVFTNYLCLESPNGWCKTVGNGTSVTWPNGVGANGNKAVADYVNGTGYSIGYVELQYVSQGHLTYANLQNPALNFILPSLQTTSFAVSNYTLTASFPASNGDWSKVRMLNQGGALTYPIASFTYLLVYRNLNVVADIDLKGRVQAQALVDFLNWAVTTGQTFSPGNNYVKLPANVLAVDQAGINSITYSEVSTPVTRNISLSIGPSGFNASQPGPSITVNTGDTVNLKLNNLDGHQHTWYIDFNNNTVQDGNETYIQCSSVTLAVTICPSFTPIIWNIRSIPHEGTFTYRDNATTASGSITVLPAQAAAVFAAPGLTVDVNPTGASDHRPFAALDSTREGTVGSLLIDLRTNVISGNVTVVAADKSTASINGGGTHTFQIAGLQLGTVPGTLGLAVRFMLNVAVGPYALSSDILVQLNLVPVCRPTYGGVNQLTNVECYQATTTSFLTRELDMNGHGVVDISDVGTVLSAFGTTIGNPGYNPLADLTGSGTVNIFGVGTLLANYGYKVFYN
jgi:phosphate transport system substrate-binding protein